MIANVRTLHLDDDRPAVAQLRGVHLSEARRAERLLVERREQLADSRAELLLDDLFDVGRRNRSTSSCSFSSSSM